MKKLVEYIEDVKWRVLNIVGVAVCVGGVLSNNVGAMQLGIIVTLMAQLGLEIRNSL